MKTVVIDAFDSFVFVIDQYLRELRAGPIVLRADPSNVARVRSLEPDLVVLGPGPGHPDESGHPELVRAFADSVPILGVCLGHQAIASAFGAAVAPGAHVMHGKTSMLDHDGRGVFLGAAPDQVVTRYHSLAVAEETLPAELEVSARSRDDGYVMGIRHVSLPIESVQFHPESITTDDGLAMFRRFLQQHVGAWNSQ